MICYPVGVTEVEILAINDYWLISNESRTGFLYTLKEIDNTYKPNNSRPISVLTKKSRFFTPHPAFTCQNCRCKKPVKNRSEYIRRTKSEGEIICCECSNLKHQRDIDIAHRTLKEYKTEIFKPVPYLDSLTFEESFALLVILSEQTQNSHLLGEELNDVTITGIQSIDQRILLSLIEKKALVYISALPSDVESSNTLLNGASDCLTYDKRSKKLARYQHPDSIATGVYLSALALDEALDVTDISSILYHKLRASAWPIDDVKKAHQTIKEVQLGKLYQLVMEVTREYKLPVENSTSLSSLLNHLVNKYPPQNIFYTFRVYAQAAAARIHKESPPWQVAARYFTSLVREYIEGAENRGFTLNRVWTIPSNIQTSPFEALFSQLYLDGHFNWNKLSAGEVVSKWLGSARLSEEVQGVLSDDSLRDDM